ncbi:hypothetical protein NYE80_20275 [Paenibacillus sp. FSL H7-0357]|uniref:hypothetical protein n=1 Tax=Paenibacillus sp. FSL H7-0357 TaxID=1536774 RepID=UPI000AAF3C0E
MLHPKPASWSYKIHIIAKGNRTWADYLPLSGFLRSSGCPEDLLPGFAIAFN